MAGGADDQAAHGVAHQQDLPYLAGPRRRQLVKQPGQLAAVVGHVPAGVVTDVYRRVAELRLQPAAVRLGGQAASLLGVVGRPSDSGAALVNTVIGDRLGPELTPLAIRMAVRARGSDVELASQQVREAFGDATPKLAVFVHGLVETENSWLRQVSRSERRPPSG